MLILRNYVIWKEPYIFLPFDWFTNLQTFELSDLGVRMIEVGGQV